jgi:hypothetical protein
MGSAATVAFGEQPARRAFRAIGPRGWSVLAALLAALLAAPMLQAPLPVFDGGIAASAGTFILHGRIPYRDFWLLYGPLTAYLAAGLTALFGTDLTVLRVAGIVLVACTALLGYWLVRDRVPRIPGVVLAVAASTIAVRSTGVDLWPWALSMALVLAAILVAQRRTDRSLLAAGAILGLAALARQDLGAYGLIAVIISSRNLRPLVGAAVVLVPAAIALLLVVPVQALFEQLIWFPLVGQHVFRALSGPSLTSFLAPGATLGWLLYWPPLGVIGLTLARCWRQRSMTPTVVALLILAILCRLQTLGRADEAHSAEAIAPVILLLGFALTRPHGRLHRLALSLGASIVIALAALPLTMLGAGVDPYDVALRTAVAVVRTETQPDEPIFVGEVHNLHTLLNPLIAYYLADRPAGVRDTMYNPGITNTPATQTRMVADLRANRVRFLILDVRFADCFEPTNDSRLPGATILDQAIDKDYVVVADFGTVIIMALPGTVTSVAAPPLWVDPAPPTGGSMSCTTNAAP